MKWKNLLNEMFSTVEVAEKSADDSSQENSADELINYPVPTNDNEVEILLENLRGLYKAVSAELKPPVVLLGRLWKNTIGSHEPYCGEFKSTAQVDELFKTSGGEIEGTVYRYNVESLKVFTYNVLNPLKEKYAQVAEYERAIAAYREPAAPYGTHGITEYVNTQTGEVVFSESEYDVDTADFFLSSWRSKCDVLKQAYEKVRNDGSKWCVGTICNLYGFVAGYGRLPATVPMTYSDLKPFADAADIEIVDTDETKERGYQVDAVTLNALARPVFEMLLRDYPTLEVTVRNEQTPLKELLIEDWIFTADELTPIVAEWLNTDKQSARMFLENEVGIIYSYDGTDYVNVEDYYQLKNWYLEEKALPINEGKIDTTSTVTTIKPVNSGIKDKQT